MKSLKHLTTSFLVVLTLFVGPIAMFSQRRAGTSPADARSAKAGPRQDRTEKAASKINGVGTALFPLEEVAPGMKGVARTVFAGSEPQGFTLEILGVLPGFTGPRQSTIIAKLSGASVDRTGVFAGMSGSPVFIDDRLVGAIAYSFPFAKEPICGITPIKQMIEIFEQGTDKPKSTEARAVSFSALASADWKLTLPKQPVAS